jgi:UDP-GlcNAc:undecaprenyl-phosphate GlcNAc-1-phosphate transferase
MNFNNTFQLSIYFASILSFLITFLGCFIIIKTNNKFEYQNSNQKRLSNLNIVPLGGIAMATSFFISVRFLGEADSNIQYIALFALGVSILGIIDDFKNLNWKLKIIFQLLLVLIPISQLNLFINIENLIGVNLNNILNLFFSIFWVLLLMNSINFIDNMDGFASTNSSFICLAITILAFIYNQNYLADISFILLFCLRAFSLFNFPPAKIYMGDSGSLFIGYILGFISILFDWNPGGESYIYSSIAPVFLFFTIPLLDFSTVFFHRIKNNISPATGGTDHISHRMLNQGHSVKKVLAIFSLVNIFIFILLALSITFKSYSILIFLVYIFFIIFLFLKFQRMEPLN